MNASDLRPGLELAPISGVRFSSSVVGDLEAVTCPPYDLIDEEDLARLRAGGAHNIVQVTLPGGDYAAAGRLLRSWLESGVLTVDGPPALYVYEESGPGRLQRGLLGAVGLRAESERVVLPHEDVYPGPVRDRLALMSATRANLEPIFLTYQGDGPASDLLDATADHTPPLLEITAADGTSHRLWRLFDDGTIAADLAPRQALIADGHHRYAAYRAYQATHGGAPGPWDYGLALLVDTLRHPPHLGAIHRVLPHLDPHRAAAQARTSFKVTSLPTTPPASPPGRGRPTTGSTAPGSVASAATGPASSTPEGDASPEGTAFREGGTVGGISVEALEAAVQELAGVPEGILLAGGGRLWLLSDPSAERLEAVMPKERSARWRALNTAILDHLLIGDAWRVTPDEHSVLVVHDDPVHAVAKAARTGGTAVILNPLTVPEIMELAAGGERVPRKSTSFGPKPRTGLLMRLLA
ncbi:DUF1015 domain-containing protein [Actinocorallia lasiicapitis]